MASGDRSSILGIPGAWISKELDLDLSLPAPLTPPSSKQPAYISRSSKEPSTFPLRRDSLPPPAVPIVVHSTPRASYPTLRPRKSNPRVRKAAFVMPVDLKVAAEATPQSVLSLLDGASNASSTFLPSPIDVPPSPLPKEPAETLSGDTTSIHSGVSGLHFGPSGSPLSKYNSDIDFPTFQDDLAYKGSASHDSLYCSAVDALPSSASIPSITSGLRLRNLPISNGLPLEPHSIYFSAIEGDLSMSRRSDDGPEPAHETSSSFGSTSDLCIPSAEEAHNQIFWRENPSPRRPTARIEVRNEVLEHGAIRQESFTYACKSLPYNAGFRPHVYVDNREHTTHGKNHPEVMTNGSHDMEESVEEDYVTGKSKRSTIFRKLAEGKRISKLLRFRKTPKRPFVDPCNSNPQSPAAFYSASNLADRSSVTADDTNHFPTPPPSSPPPPYPIHDKKRDHTIFGKTWSRPRSLSIFVVPKPKVEGRVVPSPKELPMDLPAGEIHLSPLMYDGEIPQTDVRGRLYGPSRVASPDLSPRSPDPSIFGRKEGRSWFSNVRSSKNSPLVT